MEEFKEPRRISRSELFMETAKLIAMRSHCPKKQVGAVLIRDNRIIATGYNGVLPGEKHSSAITTDGITHTVHAEANLIAFCAKFGLATNSTILYITMSPCEKCAEIIIQAGIKEVVYLEEYRDTAGLTKLRENDVLIGQYK